MHIVTVRENALVAIPIFATACSNLTALVLVSVWMTP